MFFSKWIAATNVTIVPGTEDVTFRNFGTLEGGSPSISGENVAFIASSSEGGGIYAHIGGSLRVIADTNTPVPGQPGETFWNFAQLSGTSPSISGENVVFATSCGIYASINGELRRIADMLTQRYREAAEEARRLESGGQR